MGLLTNHHLIYYTLIISLVALSTKYNKLLSSVLLDSVTIANKHKRQLKVININSKLFSIVLMNR